MRKKLLSICLLLLIAISAGAQTEFTVGNFKYTVTDDVNHYVSVAQNGDNQPTGAITIPSSVTYEAVPYVVTSVGASGFYETGITSVTIPASVLSVGSQAFYNCDGLTSITIEDSETALQWNGTDYHPLDQVGSNYTLYLGRNLTTGDNCSFFPGATSVEIGNQVTVVNPNLFDGAYKLANVTMGTGVTTIGQYAFRSTGTDESVTAQSITLGANVTTIGEGAFYNCSKLTTLDLGTKLTAIPAYMLYDCSALTSVTIPASVLSVGSQAFYNCDGLTSITIEDSETALQWNGTDYHPLDEVSSNYTLYLGRNLTTADNWCFFPGASSVNIGGQMTVVNPNLFNGATQLANVTMGSGVTTIGRYAFQNTGTDESVMTQSITLGANVTTIGEGAFYNCSKLTTLDLGTKLTAIPENMLFNCSALTSITIPASVQSVGSEAFYNCDGLTTITIEDSGTALEWNGTDYHPLNEVSSNYTLYLGRNLTTADNWCFFPGASSVNIGGQMTVVNPNLFNGATQLANVTMGSGVTTIGRYAFQNTGTDESVTAQSITLGANVTTIGEGAFYNCSKLTTLDLGTKLTAIPAYMLYDCSALTSVTIPASVLSVGSQAFYNCDGLTSITIEDSETALQWNGTDYHPLDQVSSNYTLYLGRNLTTAANWCFFPGATSVEFGPQVTSINPYLFQGCISLSNINMTNATSLTSIGAYAFDGAGNGDSVDELTVAFGSSLTTIGTRAFNNCDKIKSLTIPANVTTIEANAFWNMDGDLNLTIEDSETPLTINAEDSYYPIFEYKNITGYIGRNILRTGNYENEPVFNTSSSYQHHLTFGPKVTAIGEKEYYDCDALRTVSGMENVESIGNQAFRSCGNLTSISFGTKLQTIGIAAFAECEALPAIELPATLKVLTNPSEDVRYGVFEGCSALATVILPEGLEEIGHYAFLNCSSLTSITIPSTVTTIGRAPFFGCNAMTDMVVADSDTPIQFNNAPGSPFTSGRYNLTPARVLTNFYLGRDIIRQNTTMHSLVYDANNIEIGPKVTDIELFFTNTGDNPAFEDQVQTVKVHAVTPIAILENAFHNTTFTNATLLVPGGTTAAYAADDNNWKKFTNVDYWSTLVTLTATAHGSIATAEATATNGSEEYRQPKEDAVVYTLTADEGYELTALTDNDEPVSPLPALGEAQTRTNASGEEFVTLNATFSAINYTLDLTLNDGTATNPETYTIETETFTLNNPTKTGYTFAGWKLNGVGDAMMTVTITQGSTGDLAYTATWTPVSYTISYDLAGGSVASANPTSYTIESAAITLNNPTREGYTFAGWTGTGLDAATTAVTIAAGSTGHLAYTATWQVNQYTITFNSNGGTDVDPITQDYGTEVVAPANPTREGYTFTGWSPAIPATIPAENMTLVAQWSINQFTVTITGGGVTADNNSPKYGDNVVLTIMDDPDAILASLTVNGNDVTNDIVDNQYTITSVSGNVSVVATWNSTKEIISMAHDVATFSCDRDLDFSEVSGLKAYIASGYDRATGTVLLTRVESVPAGTGLLLVGTEGATYKIPYETSTSFFVNLLQPVLDAQVVPATESTYTNFLYGEKEGVKGFYKSSGEGTVSAKKAYLQLPTSALGGGAGVRVAILFDDADEDEETAIKDMQMANGDEAVYNLNGLRVANKRDMNRLPKGIYIIGGRKVTLK